MKKLLLTLAAVVGMGWLANADTYTYSASEIMGNPTANKEFKTLADNTAYVGGFSFKALKNEGTTEPTYNNNGKDLRIYAKNTLEVTANGAKITSIEFTISTQGLKRQPDVTPSNGSIAAQGANPLVWNGSNAAVTFTVGDKATYGSEGAEKAGQFDFSSVTITTDGPVTNFDAPGTETPADASAIYQVATSMAAGSYVIYAENSIMIPLEDTKSYGYLQTEAATVANNQITTKKANAFEFVAVDGGYNMKDSYGRYIYQSGTYNSFNVSAEILAEVDANCYLWTVEVADGAFVIKNASVEKTIQYDTQYGSFGSYPDVRGVYPVLYKYVKDAEGTTPPVEERTSVTSLAQLPSLDNKTKITVDVDLTVVYSNGAYVYVYDGQKYGLIYKKDLGLEAGQIITKGWNAAISIYSNLIEIVPDDATLAANAGGTVPEPVEIEGDQVTTSLIAANQNTYIKLIDVTFSQATPAADANKDEAGNDLRAFTGTVDGNEVAFYQRFGVESVPAGTYNVIGFISVYKENVQVYPVSISASGSISSAEIENGAVEYFNLQGVKVDNPREGSLYIRVQGNKAEKVIK